MTKFGFQSVDSDDIEDTGAEKAWFSTKSLHHRFGLGATTPELRRRKLSEEYAEFITASSLYEVGVGQKEDVLLEAADLIITVMGTLQAHGILFLELDNALRHKAKHNDAKTDATHHVINGKIARRE